MTPATAKKRLKALGVPGYGQVLYDALTMYTQDVKGQAPEEDMPQIVKSIVTALKGKYDGYIPKKVKKTNQRDLEDLIKEVEHGRG